MMNTPYAIQRLELTEFSSAEDIYISKEKQKINNILFEELENGKDIEELLFQMIDEELNDDVLFGEVWSREDKMSLRDRSIATISALMAQGLFPQLKSHFILGKKHGVTKQEAIEIVTQLAFYCGWPKAWSAFALIKEVYGDEATKEEHGGVLGQGEPNVNFAQYFVGNSYLKPLAKTDNMFIANVTFEPRCRNNWHIHHSSNGGGQILICVDGEGWYQEEGKEARRLKPGDVVTIPANVKHWHGATAKSWFSHIAIEVPGENTSNEWCEKVSDEEYNKLPE